MSERDPWINPMLGDVWSWADDLSPCAIVGKLDSNGAVWLYSPHDNLPLMRCPLMDWFLKWAATAEVVKKAEG